MEIDYLYFENKKTYFRQKITFKIFIKNYDKRYIFIPFTIF